MMFVELKEERLTAKHRYKILGGVISPGLGAAIGLAVGAFFAAPTLGLSLLVGAGIGAAMGALVGGTIGVGIGTIADNIRSKQKIDPQKSNEPTTTTNIIRTFTGNKNEPKKVSEPNKNTYYAYIQTKNRQEYDVLKESMKFYFHNNGKESLFYSSKEYRLYFNIPYQQFLLTNLQEKMYYDSLKDHRIPICGKKITTECSVNLTPYCKNNCPDEVSAHSLAKKRLQETQFTKNLEEKRSGISFKSNEVNEIDFESHQIIIVKDNHDISDAQGKILDYYKKSTSKNNYLIVEFASHTTKNTDEIRKEVCENLNFSSFNSIKVTPNTKKMISRAALKGDVIGGENSLSTEINNQMRRRGLIQNLLEPRKKYFDASVALRVNEILKENPDAKIIIWAGSAHAEGIIQNILTLQSKPLTNVIVSPSGDEPGQSFTATSTSYQSQTNFLPKH
jgi:hypothetical protein